MKRPADSPIFFAKPAAFRAWLEKHHLNHYKNRKAPRLISAPTKPLRAESAAWKFFQQQPKSYRQTAIWWVVIAKRPQTRENRLQRLIALSKTSRRLWR